MPYVAVIFISHLSQINELTNAETETTQKTFWRRDNADVKGWRDIVAFILKVFCCVPVLMPYSLPLIPKIEFLQKNKNIIVHFSLSLAG